VQLLDPTHTPRTASELEGNERRMYHLMDWKEEEQKEKETKIRIIQHRISRKNSLTLLQLQNMGEANSRIFDKKAQHSAFYKKSINNIAESQLEDSKLSINSDRHSNKSDSEDSDGPLLDDISNSTELTAIHLRTPSLQSRKSQMFKALLKNISESKR
jgi:hypothetical protein